MKARTHPLSLWNIPYAQAHWEGRGHIGRIREITHEGWEDSHNSGADVWASEPCAEVGPGAQWVWEGSAGCLSRGAPAIHLLLRHLSVSGKAACVIYRAVSRTYRHHGLGEHKYSSTMKNKVGVSQVITGRPGRGQREDRSLLSGAMFVQDTAVSLPDLLAACGPRKYSPPSWNGLSLWNSKHHTFQTPLSLFPGVQCHHHRAGPTLGSISPKFPLLKTHFEWCLLQAVPPGHLTEKCLPLLDSFYVNILYLLQYIRLPWVAQTIRSLPAMQETWVWSLGQEDPLEKDLLRHIKHIAFHFKCL